METAGLIAVIGAGVIFLGMLLAIAWICGWLTANKSHLNYMQRQHSWSSVELAQAQFNQDFFDELWENNDPRLRSC